MKKIIKYFLVVFLVSVIYVICVNFFVVFKTINNIIPIGDIEDKDYDLIVILGASVKGDEPSLMLEDRIKTGIDLYELGHSSKILMSGDNSTKYYDEVNVMKDYALNEGVDINAIYLDHAGLSTYESIYRIKENLETDKILIVSQEYHLYRALYIAESLGIDADGIASDGSNYSGQLFREIREIGARNKDFILSLFKPIPNDLEENIPQNN